MQLATCSEVAANVVFRSYQVSNTPNIVLLRSRDIVVNGSYESYLSDHSFRGLQCCGMLCPNVHAALNVEQSINAGVKATDKEVLFLLCNSLHIYWHLQHYLVHQFR